MIGILGGIGVQMCFGKCLGCRKENGVGFIVGEWV